MIYQQVLCVLSHTYSVLFAIQATTLQRQTTVAIGFIIKEHVTQCSGLAHWRVFNSFWTTIEIYGTEEYDISDFVYTLGYNT